MKVIIACLNSKYIHASLAPWCLLAGVKSFSQANVDAKVLESTINSDLSAFAQSIIDERPDVVSFSCYIWNITQTLEICKQIKQNYNCSIILGGPEVAYRRENVIGEYPFIDFVLAGEGEWAFAKFLDAYCSDKDFSTVDGICYHKGDEIIAVDEIEYHQTPPSPYCNEFFDNLNNRICYIETSRGCPYRCAFCLSGRCSKLRFFDLEQSKQNIIALANSGTQTVKFVDRTFNANSKRANEILQFIKDNYGKKIPKTVCFHFEIAGDILTTETLELLSTMPKGAVQLEIGMQSFNEDTLKKINRKTNTAKLIENIKKLLSFGNMHIHIDLIAGLTDEDLDSFKNSFNIGYSLNAHMLQMGFLKLLYGADMREKPDKYPCTFNPLPPYEITSTPCLSSDEIIALKKCEDAVDRLYNSGRFLFTLDYLINNVGYSPFDLFYDFGNAVNGEKISLMSYSQQLYDYFATRCDAQILKEKIVCDLLSCHSALQIPENLRIKHPLYKHIKKHFVNKFGNVKVAVLPCSSQVYVVKQSDEKNLFGRTDGEFYDLAYFDNMEF